MKPSISRLLVALALSAIAASALAQQYKWKDSRGHTQYGDIPPPGVKAIPLKATFAPAPAAPAAGKDDKAAAKGPLTPAEKEAEFRKRQLEARKAQEKEQQLAKDAAAKKENCARAREAQRTLESGQRIVRIDAQGERHFLGDAERAQQVAKAREAVASSCD
jgi:hypothetical protein